MSKKSNLPVALTIAGSDSGGGAGVQADLKTFAALRVHGTSAITCITAQNPKRVFDIEACSPRMVRKQIEAVFEELSPGAAKTGMLYSATIIQVVADFFRPGRGLPLVVDPVMVATSGTRLLKPGAINTLRTILLPLAALVTPNLDEAAMLTGKRLRSVEDMRRAAREINATHGCAVMVKGGHLRGHKEAVDIYWDGRTELLLSVPFVPHARLHGTGCALSAAIAGHLALGFNLPSAVIKAKEHIAGAISQSREAGGHAILNHQWR